jgi:hypothetical protein
MKKYGRNKFRGLRAKFRRWPKWLKAGLLVLPPLALCLVFVLPRLFGPTLSGDQQEWRDFSGDDPGRYSLEVLRHGYRMIQAYRSEERMIWGERFRSADLVSWEWFVEIRNKSWKDLAPQVSYFLTDKDHLLVDIDYVVEKPSIPSGTTVRVEHQSEMLYTDAQRVVGGVWEISWREKGFSHKSRRINY